MVRDSRGVFGFDGAAASVTSAGAAFWAFIPQPRDISRRARRHILIINVHQVERLAEIAWVMISTWHRRTSYGRKTWGSNRLQPATCRPPWLLKGDSPQIRARRLWRIHWRRICRLPGIEVSRS